MSIDQYEKFSYENNFLKFNSNINGFTEAVFKEFDKESDENFLPIFLSWTSSLYSLRARNSYPHLKASILMSGNNVVDAHMDSI